MQTGTASINGQQYDQVIDVDISDGAPPLKLGVNCSDNPYDVADRYASLSSALKAKLLCVLARLSSVIHLLVLS